MTVYFQLGRMDSEGWGQVTSQKRTQHSPICKTLLLISLIYFTFVPLTSEKCVGFIPSINSKKGLADGSLSPDIQSIWSVRCSYLSALLFSAPAPLSSRHYHRIGYQEFQTYIFLISRERRLWSNSNSHQQKIGLRCDYIYIYMYIPMHT